MPPGAPLPNVSVPTRLLPQFSFLQQIRIVYIHSLLRRIGNSTHNRIVAITANGEMGIFVIDGGKKATFVLETDIEAVCFNHKCVFLVLTTSNLDSDAGEPVVVFDFDMTGANIRGNETKDQAVKRFLGVSANFIAPGTLVRRVGPQATAATVIAELQQQQAAEQQDLPNVMGRAPGQSMSAADGPPPPYGNHLDGTTSPSSAAKEAGIGQKFKEGMFRSFSWVGSKFSKGPGKQASDDDELPTAGVGDGDGSAGYTTAMLDPVAARQATVAVDQHEKQRRKVRRWHEEVLSRMGEREGLDAKERILDDVARLEAQLKKQRALTEAPPPPSPEEELRQQRALAALVMFICRRRALLSDAKTGQIAQLRPAQGQHHAAAAANEQVSAAAPVFPSYVDVFRSCVLGM